MRFKCVSNSIISNLMRICRKCRFAEKAHLGGRLPLSALTTKETAPDEAGPGVREADDGFPDPHGILVFAGAADAAVRRRRRLRRAGWSTEGADDGARSGRRHCRHL